MAAAKLPQTNIHRHLKETGRHFAPCKRRYASRKAGACPPRPSQSLLLVFLFSQVSIYEVDKQDCRKFCTTGIDGAMTIWDFKVLSIALRTHLIGA
ncbi:ARPC1A [Cervus elaphus hippelaphus]|uniref:ARPC1A n=1 Tax=Cervus elaphus hippelaphus TaxID=46360 RepID=A0A212CZ02_CEREH|nr:ARPC1A [Cervus elaphus hippelaphus]